MVELSTTYPLPVRLTEQAQAHALRLTLTPTLTRPRLGSGHARTLNPARLCENLFIHYTKAIPNSNTAIRLTEQEKEKPK